MKDVGGWCGEEMVTVVAVAAVVSAELCGMAMLMVIAVRVFIL